MRNRLLAIIRDTIPYVKELRPHAKSIAACIVMQQLDYWFLRYPEGFFKFLAPCNHRAYKAGDSWMEELAVSKEEFRTAFDNIGVRYSSKTEFEEAPDKFQGKFYCSYHNKRDGETYYFRNHELVDALLDTLDVIPFAGNWQPQSTEVGNPNLQRLAKPISPHRQPQSLQVGIPNPESNREHTENTHREQQQPSPVPPVPPDVVVDVSLVSELMSELTEAGITVTQARRLVKEFAPERIRKHLQATHWKKTANPPGGLVAAIREDWPIQPPPALPRPKRPAPPAPVRPSEGIAPPPDLRLIAGLRKREGQSNFRDING